MIKIWVQFQTLLKLCRTLLPLLVSRSGFSQREMHDIHVWILLLHSGEQGFSACGVAGAHSILRVKNCVEFLDLIFRVGEPSFEGFGRNRRAIGNVAERT